MNRLIIDITYLAHWKGRLTGIPRVINELAIRYQKEPGTVFVIWDAKAECFFEADLNDTLKTRGEKIRYKVKKGSVNHFLNTLTRYTGIGIIFRVVRKVGRKLHFAPLLYIASALIAIRYATNAKLKAKRNDTFLIPMGLWHSKAYIQYIQRLHTKGVKIVQISYDMLPVVTPQYSSHSTKSMLSYNLATFPISSLILCISEYTKNDIETWLKSKRQQIPAIEVFRLGDDFDVLHAKESSRLKRNTNLQRKQYILCVGTMELRKNHAILYYVYKLAEERRIDLPHLVIVGRKGWQGEGVYDLLSKDPEIRNKVTIITDGTDKELAWLYTNAMFTIYPSFYEGWGLPVAESIAYGVPSLASNNSSIPEIAGDLIEYFNPISAEDILSKIQYMQSPAHLAEAVKKVKQYKPTTWDQTYSQVHETIKGLYEEN